MRVVSLLHQKGGTGKSTLAIALATAVAGGGESVLLVDADPQGTSSDWGHRFGDAAGVETRLHIQPDFPEQVARWASQWSPIVIDSPPGLSPVTESILAVSDRVIIPVRPALPDLWALPWLAALIRKMRRSGSTLDARLVVNMHRGEPLAPLLAEIEEWDIPVWEETVPADESFAGLYEGRPLPDPLLDLMRRLIAE